MLCSTASFAPHVFVPPFCTGLSVPYLPGDGEVILSFAAGSDYQVTLVQGLHHLLRLVEADIVEVGVGNHTLYICWKTL